MAGRETHVPALHFVGELVPFTQDVPWIREIVAGYLPADYAGNTLDEIARLVSDSLKKGYGTPRKKGRTPIRRPSGEHDHEYVRTGDIPHAAECAPLSP